MQISERRPLSLEELQSLARACRRDALTMIFQAGSGHPGGSLSVMDILVALFFSHMRLRPNDPYWPERDYFILSKGHAAPALYSVMAKAGFFPESELQTLRHLNSRLQGHPDRVRLPGIEASTGSLGQGLSIAQGLALAAQRDGSPSRTFCVLGDGECQEGQIWEVALSAPKFNLEKLVVFIDANGGQIDGPVEKVLPLEPLVSKWKACRWNTLEIDGHDYNALAQALHKTTTKAPQSSPWLIVARTIKGKGVSFMENNMKWHGSAPQAEQYAQAMEELRG